MSDDEVMAVNIDKAAELIGVHPHTIRALIKSGDLRASHIGKRWVIEVDELRRMLRSTRSD